MPILGTINDDAIIYGTQGDDNMNGLAGDDVMNGRKGDDVMKGGTGSDVVTGGLGADTFQWSAGHITDGATDYVTDFSFAQGDTLKFLDSFAQGFEIVQVVHETVAETEANGANLMNGFKEEVIFTVRNAATGATQDIVLLDAFANNTAAAWDAYLAEMGLTFGEAEPEPEICEIHSNDETYFSYDECDLLILT